jgi:hypothetical protein
VEEGDSDDDLLHDIEEEKGDEMQREHDAPPVLIRHQTW